MISNVLLCNTQKCYTAGPYLEWALYMKSFSDANEAPIEKGWYDCDIRWEHVHY